MLQLDDAASKYMNIPAYSPVGADFTIEMMVRITDEGSTTYPSLFTLNSGTTDAVVTFALNKSGDNNGRPYLWVKDDSSNGAAVNFTSGKTSCRASKKTSSSPSCAPCTSTSCSSF